MTTVYKDMNEDIKNFIPMRFVRRKETFRQINLPDCQFLDIKKDNEILKVRISDIKRG